jgi:hypothetical protein
MISDGRYAHACHFCVREAQIRTGSHEASLGACVTVLAYFARKSSIAFREFSRASRFRVDMLSLPALIAALAARTSPSRRPAAAATSAGKAAPCLIWDCARPTLAREYRLTAALWRLWNSTRLDAAFGTPASRVYSCCFSKTILWPPRLRIISPFSTSNSNTRTGPLLN